MRSFEKFHLHIAGDYRPSVIWAENPFQAVLGCRLFDEVNLVEVNESLNKYVFICTMAEPHVAGPCDSCRVSIYKVG